MESSGPDQRHNRLIFEKSPYLLQHATNPVDWYPWGAEAFDKALREDKPLFLSIGYSTCHWCHVMERESFEDAEVARLMNDTVVAVKVDREERPDIDRVYMNACQVMSGSGGWPLTVVMTPDKKPFFTGTYFPKESVPGRIGMVDLLPRIRQAWTSQRNELCSLADRITASLQQVQNRTMDGVLDKSVLTAAYERLAESFDPQHGGFGAGVKFPTPHNLLFLLRYWKRTADPVSLAMVEQTLQAMRRGGIFDHVGFGFHRYSTDARWLVPHFEKMLYDQAMLAIAYVETYQATGQDLYAQTTREIFDYVLRDMTSPLGGFYSAEDADSEGVEGKFYHWTEREARQVLGATDADLVVEIFGIQPKGNFGPEVGGENTGENIIHLEKPIAELAFELGVSEDELRRRLEESRQKLFVARAARLRPHRDDKVLTDWNGLMIAALAKGAQALGEPAYLRAAEAAARFTLDQLRDDQGRLLHRYCDGQSAIMAKADDYAFLTWGLIELYEATFDVTYLRMALRLTKDLLEHFWDKPVGGLFITADDDEALVARPKEAYDGALPSANSVTMLNLLRLGSMTGNLALQANAGSIGRAFATAVRQAPSAHTQLLLALDFSLGHSHEVVIVGEPEAEDVKAMVAALRQQFLPNKVVLFRPAGDSPEISELAPFTIGHVGINGRATAYVCADYSCRLPVTDPDRMLELLGAARKG